MMFTCLNEAISVALEKRWGFHYRQFIPREIIAMYRKEASNHYPQLLKVNEFHIEAVEKLFERADLDTNLFELIAPIYSGRFDKDGKLHVFKGKDCRDRAGDIQIAPAQVEHFMKTVIHDEWRQEMRTAEFTFERAGLTALSSEMPYTTYGD